MCDRCERERYDEWAQAQDDAEIDRQNGYDL